jgi:undecaprenyl-diphosphatase
MDLLLMMLDNTIIFWIQDNLVSELLTPFMVGFSLLGNLGLVWIIAGLWLLTRKKYRRAGLAVFIALFFSLVVGNGVLKPLAARVRPCFDYPWVPLLVSSPAAADFSFPSGHTFGSFAAAAAMFHALGPKKGLGPFLLAAVIGFSRLYLFLHYPSDVLAGAAFGTCFGILAWFCSDWVYAFLLKHGGKTVWAKLSKPVAPETHPPRVLK